MESSNKKDSKVLLWFKKNITIQTIVINALIAALYAVITILCGPLSYNGGSLQLRFSELLNLLVFFNPTYTIGLTIGCLLSNIMSQYGLPDMIFGTLGTLLGCILIIIVRKTTKNLLLSGFMPCLTNSLIVPLIVYLYDTSMNMDATTYFIIFGWTFLGEFICIICVGYPLFLLLSKKYKGFYNLIDARTGKDFKF